MNTYTSILAIWLVLILYLIGLLGLINWIVGLFKTTPLSFDNPKRSSMRDFGMGNNKRKRANL